MNKFFESLFKLIWSFWFLIVATVVAVLFVVLYAYRQNFGGEFSPLASDWSAFGSYMGGILGPLVSFLTLLAVLKTVYLQRELLDVQAREFARMDEHQISASSKQDKQLSQAKMELEISRAQAYLSTQLELLETLRAHFRREADGMGEAVTQIMGQDGFSALKMNIAEEPLQKKEAAEQKIADLIGLSLELSILRYSTVDEISKVSGPKIHSIIYGNSKL